MNLRAPRPVLRVRSVPAGHDYVRHAIGPAARPAADDATGVAGVAAGVAGVAAGAIEVLADPVIDPDDPERWWPHPVLEVAERPQVLDGADLVHVHFGYEHRSPEQVAEFVAAVRARGLPLVVTVHDLTNPHEPDPAAHLKRTGHLVRGADAVITLTRGAAADIQRHWGVDAQVIPHPRLMPAEVTEPHRLARHARATRRGAAGAGSARAGSAVEPRTVGLALGSLRAGVAAEGLLTQLTAALPQDVRLTIMVRADALAAAREPGHPRHPAALELDRVSGNAEVEVSPHQRLSDPRLCEVLAGFDALVLPHRHGTHSGWLELCRDLGVVPVIPEIGHLREQWGSDAGTYDPADTSAESLNRALRAALGGATDDRPPIPPRPATAEDAAVAAAHLEVYRRAASAVSAASLVSAQDRLRPPGAAPSR